MHQRGSGKYEKNEGGNNVNIVVIYEILRNKTSSEKQNMKY